MAETRKPIGETTKGPSATSARKTPGPAYLDIVTDIARHVGIILKDEKVVSDPINDELAQDILQRTMSIIYFRNIDFGQATGIDNLESIIIDISAEIAEDIGLQYRHKNYSKNLNNEEEIVGSQKLSRPDLPRWAEENRPTKMVRIRLEPGLVEEMDKAASAQNRTRTSIIDSALREYLKFQPS